MCRSSNKTKPVSLPRLCLLGICWPQGASHSQAKQAKMSVSLPTPRTVKLLFCGRFAKNASRIAKARQVDHLLFCEGVAKAKKTKMPVSSPSPSPSRSVVVLQRRRPKTKHKTKQRKMPVSLPRLSKCTAHCVAGALFVSRRNKQRCQSHCQGPASRQFSFSRKLRPAAKQTKVPVKLPRPAE